MRIRIFALIVGVALAVGGVALFASHSTGSPAADVDRFGTPFAGSQPGQTCDVVLSGPHAGYTACSVKDYATPRAD